jgi:hypothetical protein
MPVVWGIHNDALTTELVDGEFVSIGWDKIGDISKIGPDREALKEAQRQAYPETKPGGSQFKLARFIDSPSRSKSAMWSSLRISPTARSISASSPVRINTFPGD